MRTLNLKRKNSLLDYDLIAEILMLFLPCFYIRSATLGHSVNTVNAQAGKFFNKIGDLIQGGMAGKNVNFCNFCVKWLQEKQ